jgi:mRNA interferase RelE/StbE
MTYRIQLNKSATKQLESLYPKARERIQARLDALSENPRSQGTIKLTSQGDSYRIRVGDYRVVYEIQDAELIVLVIKIAHRREVYR